MSNMSYCRFENTANDLLDCITAIEEGETDDLNSYERTGMANLLKLAERLLEMRDEWGLDELTQAA